MKDTMRCFNILCDLWVHKGATTVHQAMCKPQRVAISQKHTANSMLAGLSHGTSPECKTNRLVNTKNSKQKEIMGNKKDCEQKER